MAPRSGVHDAHPHWNNLYVGFAIAAIVALLAYSTLRPLLHNPETMTAKERIAYIDSLIEEKQWSEVVRILDKLIGIYQDLVIQSAYPEAVARFRELAETAARANAQAQPVWSTGHMTRPDSAPVAPEVPVLPRTPQNAFGLGTREATARYYLAVSLFKSLQARYAEAFAKAEEDGQRFVPPGNETDPIRKAVQQGIEADRSDDRLWRLLGLIEHMTGRFPQAALALEQALAINPEFAEAYNDLGRVYVNLQEFEKARGMFTAALAVGKEIPGVQAAAHYNLGLIYSRQSGEEADLASVRQNREQARKHLEAYVDLAEADPQGLRIAREELQRLQQSK